MLRAHRRSWRGLLYNHFILYSHFVLLTFSHQFLDNDQPICKCCLHEKSLTNKCLITPLLCCRGNEEQGDEEEAAGALLCACDGFEVMSHFVVVLHGGVNAYLESGPCTPCISTSSISVNAYVVARYVNTVVHHIHTKYK